MMKEFFKIYHRLLIVSIIIWAVLLVLFIVNVSFSMIEVNRSVTDLLSKQNTSDVEINWDNQEVKELFKEKLWLENQVALANNNSFSMGLNLKDSLVQVQLKGTVLFESKILYQRTPRFFNSTGKEAYLNYFSEITFIDTSSANIPKRPIKKVIAPAIGSEVEARKPDTVQVDRIHWEFITGNQINVVINGAYLSSDSTNFDIPASTDVRGYRINNGLGNIFSGKYIPTLFLWLNDSEAKAIYRAIPDNAEIIFRN